jgi:hypothetical protein
LIIDLYFEIIVSKVKIIPKPNADFYQQFMYNLATILVINLKI